jgi:hypothetical protein
MEPVEAREPLAQVELADLLEPAEAQEPLDQAELAEPLEPAVHLVQVELVE